MSCFMQLILTLHIWTLGRFWGKSVDIQVFRSLNQLYVDIVRFSLLIQGIFYMFFYDWRFPEVLNLNQSFLRLNPTVSNYQLDLPIRSSTECKR